MAISDTQKVDYLFKKIGFGSTKTDINSVKLAANESIPSPLLLRGDKVWQQAVDIPATKPGSSTGVVTVYTGATTVETTADITASTNRTWKTGITDWIPPEFGATYLVNVYVHTSGDAANASSGTKLFITGSGNNDEWFFDYQSGVLNFIGDNLPNGIDFSGKSIYIEGAIYSGAFGVGAAAGEDATLGNLIVSDTTISTANINDDIILSPNGTGVVDVDAVGLLLPDGTTGERSTSPTAGEIRYNTSSATVEFYDGTQWRSVGTQTSITFDTFIGDGSTASFTLSQSSIDGGVIVSINGVLQHDASYSVSGTTLTVDEPVADGDVLEARTISATTTIQLEIGRLQVYTTAEANALSGVEAGGIAYISDGNAGNPCLAVYDGSNWKVFSFLQGNISSS